MQALHATARKYRLPPEQLPDELLARRQQLDDLQAAQDINKVLAREAASRAAYLTLAQHLSGTRKVAAEALSAAVTDAMQGLSMAGGTFAVALNPLEEGQSHGLEQIEFLVAGHAGVSPRPLARVASGGELARISLAISVITSEAAPTPTLIFDEVDTGIGGAVAEVVGRRLQELGRSRQVLCVTHLPQVAAQAGTHLLVSKETSKDGSKAGSGPVTRSRIRVLDTDGRVQETARMLGGATVTATTMQHAEEMLAQGARAAQAAQAANAPREGSGKRPRRAAG
jgi:DNA repair protein RecN (Recombination protein N)